MTVSPWAAVPIATPQADQPDEIFFVGDIVRLKSCLWTMTVLAVSGGTVATGWFDAEGDLMTWAFPEEALLIDA